MLLAVHGDRAHAQSVAVAAASRHVCLIFTANSTLVGFRARGYKGIVTALHGVAGSKPPYRASYLVDADTQSATLRSFNVWMTKVDVAHDLAILSNDELEKGPSSEGIATPPSWSVAGFQDVVVVGYPTMAARNRIAYATKLPLPPRKLLDDLLEGSDLHQPLLKRGSPSLFQNVLLLDDKLFPGYSGAPILDMSGRVLAVANGGLKGVGGHVIGWAICWSGLKFKPVGQVSSVVAQLPQLPSRALFAQSPEPGQVQSAIKTRRVSRQRLAVLLPLALTMYAQDYDERLPPFKDVQDLIERLAPYVKGKDARTDLETLAGSFVFVIPAWNGPSGGIDQVLAFESSLLSERWGNVVFADGHIKGMDAAKFEDLMAGQGKEVVEWLAHLRTE